METATMTAQIIPATRPPPGEPSPPPDQTYDLFTQGLIRTCLHEDLAGGAPHTLLAPLDNARCPLPCSVEQLLHDEQLHDARFDVFEYLVVRGHVDAEAPRRSWDTLQGTPVQIGGGFVFGISGAARIVRTIKQGHLVLHLLDAWVLPLPAEALVPA
jgi:uncharacterized surface protein with fasciclin (FAS1) repeats